MSEQVLDAILDALRPSLQRLVREEVARAGLEWRWRTAEQAGELLGISAAAVRRRVTRGQLPGRRFEGRVYVDVHDLDIAIRDGRYDGPQLHVDQPNGRATASTAPGHGHRRR